MLLWEWLEPEEPDRDIWTGLWVRRGRSSLEENELRALDVIFVEVE